MSNSCLAAPWVPFFFGPGWMLSLLAKMKSLANRQWITVSHEVPTINVCSQVHYLENRTVVMSQSITRSMAVRKGHSINRWLYCTHWWFFITHSLVVLHVDSYQYGFLYIHKTNVAFISAMVMSPRVLSPQCHYQICPEISRLLGKWGNKMPNCCGPWWEIGRRRNE